MDRKIQMGRQFCHVTILQDYPFGQLFHVFGPGPAGMSVDPIDAEPITITDFKGVVGLAYLDGTVRRINTTTNPTTSL